MSEQDAELPPVSPEKLFNILKRHGISYALYHHAAIFTVAEGEHLKKDIPGEHCRNLFLRDKKGAMFLVVAANETQIDLRKLAGLLGCGRLSFGSAERLWQYLGIRQGAVNPFCILNDTEKRVRLVLDKGMMAAEIVNYHPMDNAMTIGLSPGDLLRFIRETGHEPEIVDLAPAAPDEAAA